MPSTGLKLAFGCHVPSKLVSQWAEGRKHIIGQIELYAVVLARVLWSKHLSNSRVIFFVDHSGVLSACINGYSHDASWRRLLRHLEEADESAPCLGWWHRVPSASHVADPPSKLLGSSFILLVGRSLQFPQRRQPPSCSEEAVKTLLA